jgi:hypothetical protein
MRVKVNVRVDTKRLRIAPDACQSQLNQSTKDCGQSLRATAAGAAPFLTGVLEKSGRLQMSYSHGSATARVDFKAMRGSFDYAQKMHNSVYNLGKLSRAKKGTTGMSGKFYPVGPKYLERPLYGELFTYRGYIETRLQKVLKGLGG